MRERGDVEFEDPRDAIRDRMLWRLKRKLTESFFLANQFEAWGFGDPDTTEAIKHHLEKSLEAIKRGYPDCH